jgi:ferredoxin-NADP reductase
MKLKLIEKRQETADSVSFILKPAEPLTWKAGQFFHYVLHHEPTDERGSDRWFTCSSAPSEGHVMLTTRFSTEKGSSFKKALETLKEDEDIEISDVDGDFLVEDLKNSYVFIAGGIGITPYRSILKQLDSEGTMPNIILLYSNKSEDNIPYKAELEELMKKYPSLKIHYIFSPERIDAGKVHELIPDLKNSYFYVSGPEPMVENLGNALKELGVAEDHLKQDWFPGYPLE